VWGEELEFKIVNRGSLSPCDKQEVQDKGCGKQDPGSGVKALKRGAFICHFTKRNHMALQEGWA